MVVTNLDTSCDNDVKPLLTSVKCMVASKYLPNHLKSQIEWSSKGLATMYTYIVWGTSLGHQMVIVNGGW